MEYIFISVIYSLVQLRIYIQFSYWPLSLFCCKPCLVSFLCARHPSSNIFLFKHFDWQADLFCQDFHIKKFKASFPLFNSKLSQGGCFPHSMAKIVSLLSSWSEDKLFCFEFVLSCWQRSLINFNGERILIFFNRKQSQLTKEGVQVIYYSLRGYLISTENSLAFWKSSEKKDSTREIFHPLSGITWRTPMIDEKVLLER